jgi:hypothetical protein
MIDKFLTGYDFNLPLNDAAVDPEIPFVRRKLADIARTEGLDGGFFEAQEVAEIFLELAHEANADITDPKSPAQLRLGEILSRNIPYQQALLDEVALLPLADAAAHLCWLAALMKHRADMRPPVSRAQRNERSDPKRGG